MKVSRFYESLEQRESKERRSVFVLSSSMLFMQLLLGSLMQEIMRVCP